MTETITLASIAAQIQKLDTRMGTGFAAVAEDIADIKERTAIKDDLAKVDHKIDAVQIQVNSIERQLRETKTELRLSDHEEKAFGKVRG